MVRGRSQPVDLCEVFLRAAQADAWRECAADYDAALDALDVGDHTRARSLLEAYAARRPDDTAVRAVLARVAVGR